MAAGDAQLPANLAAQDMGHAFCRLAKAVDKIHGPGDDDIGAMLQRIADHQVEINAYSKKILKSQAEIQAMAANITYRNWNGSNTMMNHLLKPLAAEKGDNVGQRPTFLPEGIFPKKVGDIRSLSGSQLDRLKAFYDDDELAGGTLAARRNALRAFIGVK